MNDKQAPVAIVTVAVLAVSGLVLWVIFTTKPSSPPATEPPPVNVKVSVVRATPTIADTFRLPAVVEANRVVCVAAEVDGRIEKVESKEGKACRLGAVLVKLNTELLQAEHDRAQAAANQGKADYDRMLALEKQGGTTKQVLEKAEAEMRTSRAAERLAAVRFERAEIKAPISGVVNDLLVEKGEYVQPGDPVAEIVDIDTVKVVALVPELDVPFLKVGSRAEVAANIKGKPRTLEGAVTYISELADEKTRATRIEITLPNKERLLRSGHIVRVILTRRTLENVIMVPLAAVIPMEDAKAVYVVEKDGDKETARRRIVKVDTRFIKPGAPVRLNNGETSKGREQTIRVVEGLKPGDRLIVDGQQFVSPGQNVNVRKPKPGTKPGTGPSK